MGIVKKGCSPSGHGTPKLTVSQDWIYGMNWFFAYWCKLRKAKSYFADFVVALVKMGMAIYSVHENLKSAVS